MKTFFLAAYRVALLGLLAIIAYCQTRALKAPAKGPQPVRVVNTVEVETGSLSPLAVEVENVPEFVETMALGTYAPASRSKVKSAGLFDDLIPQAKR